MTRFLLGLALLAVACARPEVAQDPTQLPRLPASDLQNLSGWKFRGELRGPLRAFGPAMQVEGWLRADGWLRVDFRYDDGTGPRRDALIWSPQVALLVDGRDGTLTTLGDAPGELDLEGGAFRVEHALWLLLGRLPRAPSGLEWSEASGDWKGRSAQVGLRGRGPADRLERTELVWRTPEGEVQVLRAQVEARDEAAALPSRVGLTGTLLSARAILELDSEPIAMVEDTTFDPLRRP